MEQLNQYLIDSRTHFDMCQNYEVNQRDLINRNLHTPTRPYYETQLVWWPLHILEEYIALLKNEMPSSLSGVSMFITANDAVGPENEPRKYSRRLTVNLVPTVNKDEVNVKTNEADDYNGLDDLPVVKGRVGDGAIQLHVIKNLADFNTIENENLILNRGHNFPPPPSNG